ncbi:efflux RND transporter periplasmic adaptor subunit [Hydrogenophaga sp.]|uniref:efflux RND transporter periplasmic adaptor subunit n=1 Tax=Hydrogenophaga sp. TaxID=1904254 RepID=UPI002730F4B6|nr:efflux RND transporter periplasmic adaptor subunit [Hydrogenophaga sp.]MDP2015809.1 efflux RND transporter periplasmic adaptor subunit [Hydrogenophaga sp.]
MSEALPAPAARPPRAATPARDAVKPKKLTRRTVVIAVASLLLVAAAGAAYWRFFRALDVPVAVATQGAIAARVVGPGTVQARIPVTLSARVSATVVQVHADVGDAVHLGQVLVTLDDRDLSARRGVVAGQQEALLRNTEGARAALVKAQADLELARGKQRRDAELLAQGFVSQAVLDASNSGRDGAVAGVNAAQAALAARAADARSLSQEARYADAVLSYTRIVSPMEGVVIQRLGEVGNTVVPGTPLLKIVDPKSLWVATRVDESVVGRIQTGQTASIRLRSGEVLPGKVARIARQSDAATRELDVHVAFDSVPQRFAIDQEAEVTIVVGEDRGILVPLTALTRDKAGREGVLAIDGGSDGGRTRFQPVETGSADARQVLIRKGLTDGEAVVANAAGVTANQPVRAAASALAP